MTNFNLTELEAKVMCAIPNDNFYENGVDSILWTDCFLDCLDMDNKIARGVLSSLVKKEMIFCDSGEDATIQLDDNGVKYLEEVGLI